MNSQKRSRKVSAGYHRHDGMLPLEYAVDEYVKDKEGKEDWAVVDELLKADDACISGFKDPFNGLYVAERVLTTIRNREKLNKLQVEKAIAGCKEVFLDMAKKDDIQAVVKALPKIEEIRKNWIAEALSQKETDKKVFERLQIIEKTSLQKKQ